MVAMRMLLSEIDPERISVGEVIYPPGGRLGPRRQDDLQLVLVHRGSATIAIDDDAAMTCGAGTVALLLPGHREEFAFDADEPTRHSWIQAHVGEAPDRFAALPRALPLSSALADLVVEAVAVTRTPLSTARPLLGALAAAALWRYAGEAESGPEPADDAVEKARRHAHAHVADPDLDLGALARAAHVSPPHLVRRFREELGVTPMAYVWRRRVAHGVDLLTHTGLPVGDIASRAGFKSVYHFSRRVKEQTGRAPTVLRRERWNVNPGH
jgi:AraC-like DNA-binding protein/quercetin dioxygenase-like cupin family protein